MDARGFVETARKLQSGQSAKLSVEEYRRLSLGLEEVSRSVLCEILMFPDPIGEYDLMLALTVLCKQLKSANISFQSTAECF